MKIYKYLVIGIMLIVFTTGDTFGMFKPQYRIATASPVLKGAISSSVRICALRVSFPADEDETTTGTGQFLMTAVNTPCDNEFVVDPAPHNRAYFRDHIRSLANYYRQVSRGKVAIDTTNSEVFPLDDNSSYQIDHPMAYYHPFLVKDSVDLRLSELLVEAVQKADPDVDFTQYDVVVVFHAGVGQDFAITLDPTPYDILSAFMNKDDLRAFLAPNDSDFQGILVEDGTAFVDCGLILPESQNHLLYDNWEEVFGESDSPCHYQFGLNGTLAFMFGFYLGLPCLFDTESGMTGIGRFGLMDQGSSNLNGLVPAVPCAWERVFLGWETPVIAKNFEDVVLKKVGSASDTSVWKIPINANEYFLVENRCAHFRLGVSFDSLQYRIYEENGMVEWPLSFPLIRDSLKAEFSPETGVMLSVPNYDYGLEGSGLLIWHIDESVINTNLATNRVNVDREHRGVDLEEGDGAQDLGYEADILNKDIEDGWFFDPWFAGNDGFIDLNSDYILDAEEHVGFTPYTNPSTCSNNYTFTGISIDSIGPAGEVMTFRIKLEDALPNFPLNLSAGAKDILPLDLNPNDQIEEFLIIDDSLRIYTAIGDQIVALPYQTSIALDKDSLLLYGAVQKNNQTSLLSLSVWKLGYSGQITTIDTISMNFQVLVSSLLPVKGGVLFAAQNYADNRNYLHLYQTATQDIESLTLASQVKKLVGGDDNIFGITDNNQVVQIRLKPLSAEVVADLPNALSGTMVMAFINQNESVDLVHCTDSLLTLVLDIGTSNEVVLRREQEFNSNLACADIDGDGKVEIITATSSQILAFNEELTVRNNFPIRVPNILGSDQFESELLIADLDNDGKKDIIINTSSALLAFNYKGDLLNGFPKIAYQTSEKSGILLNTQSGLAFLALTPTDSDIQNYDHITAVRLSSFSHNSDDWICYGGNAARQFYYPVKSQSSPIQSKSLLDNAKTFCWPNPPKNNRTYIRYFPNSNCNISINIYDLAGDLIADFKDSSPVIGEPNEKEWNVSNVESGVYFAVVKAKSGARTDSKVIKILVVK
ncbi:MAG TPA: T9SS type A sorting domain-containing protein [Candidatus Marinimicrobia bacterium]|nr:T9SS type A sorting domain-containing protein [Candidatus Neomarinimicrobiota bacterium]HRS51388.1 T9SS type A sorting domain-containing protein [Candidatus Neomarinimicrobiota bacterium]